MENKEAGLGESLGKIMWGLLLARDGFNEADSRQAEAEGKAERAAMYLAHRDRDIVNAIAAARQSRVPMIVGAGVPVSAPDMLPSFVQDSTAPSGPMMLDGDDVPLGTPGMIRVASALSSVAQLMAAQDVELYKHAAGWPTFNALAQPMKTKFLGSVKKVTSASSPVASSARGPKTQAATVAMPRVEAPKTQAMTAKMDAPQVAAPAPAAAAKVEPPSPPPAPEPALKPAPSTSSGLSARSKMMIGAGTAVAGLGLYGGVKKGLNVLGSQEHESVPSKWGTPGGIAPAAVNQYGFPQF